MLGLFLPGARFSSWYVVSIDTGHIAQSPQSGPRWSPALKMEPVLSVSSFSLTLRPHGLQALQVSPSVSLSWFLKLVSFCFVNKLICIFKSFLIAPYGMWALSAQPRPGVELRPSALRAQSHNCWITREFPVCKTF